MSSMKHTSREPPQAIRGADEDLAGTANEVHGAWDDPLKLLKRYGIRPDKRLGQNFLVDGMALRKIVDAAGLSGDETILEIGAGLGTLTRELASRSKRVVAVEYDRRLVGVLEEVLAPLSNVELIQADILGLDLGVLMGSGPYRVVANIPYNITSALIRHLLEAPNPPEQLILTLQREVAERAIAEPGAMSLLALSVQLYGVPKIVASIPPGAFYPRPKVASAVLRVEVHERPVVPRALISSLFRVAKAGFSQRRKQLHNSLSAGLGLPDGAVRAWLESAGIPREARAQELGLKEWEKLAMLHVEGGGGEDVRLA